MTVTQGPPSDATFLVRAKDYYAFQRQLDNARSVLSPRRQSEEGK